MKRAKKITKLLAFLFFGLIFIVSCNEEPEVERSKMVRTFVDITVAQSKYANFPDSLKKAKKEIFKKYEITKELYEKTIRNTDIKAEYWDKFFIEAKEYLDSLKLASKQ